MEANDFLDHGTNPNDLTITNEIKDYLIQAAKWARFLGIVGLIFVGIMVIMSLFMGTIMGSAMNDLEGMDQMGDLGVMGALGSTFITVIYLIFSVIQFFPSYYCYKFGAKMKIAINSNDQEYMREGFEFLKKLFKFTGIIMAVILGFYALMMIIGILGVGAAAAFN